MYKTDQFINNRKGNIDYGNEMKKKYAESEHRSESRKNKIIYINKMVK